MIPAGRDDTVLVTMPNKFKNLIWIKRNDYVVVTINATTTAATNINITNNMDAPNEKQQLQQQHEIKYILNKQHIKSYTAKGQWPTEFTTINDRTADYSEDLMPNYSITEAVDDVADERNGRGNDSNSNNDVVI